LIEFLSISVEAFRLIRQFLKMEINFVLKLNYAKQLEAGARKTRPV
jgi:hypothetical protein